MPETQQYLQILNKALWFTISTALFTAIYILSAGILLYKSANKVDPFSKRIVYTFMLGYLVKTGVWIAYTIIGEKLRVSTSRDVKTVDDYLFTQLELFQSEIEDCVNVTFSIILYVIVFKIVHLGSLYITFTCVKLCKSSMRLTRESRER